nr:hypothetical protein GCM10025732_10390 [Glycomyces mayteni]
MRVFQPAGAQSRPGPGSGGEPGQEDRRRVLEERGERVLVGGLGLLLLVVDVRVVLGGADPPHVLVGVLGQERLPLELVVGVRAARARGADHAAEAAAPRTGPGAARGVRGRADDADRARGRAGRHGPGVGCADPADTAAAEASAAPGEAARGQLGAVEFGRVPIVVEARDVGGLVVDQVRRGVVGDLGLVRLDRPVLLRVGLAGLVRVPARVLVLRLVFLVVFGLLVFLVPLLVVVLLLVLVGVVVLSGLLLGVLVGPAGGVPVVFAVAAGAVVLGDDGRADRRVGRASLSSKGSNCSAAAVRPAPVAASAAVRSERPSCNCTVPSSARAWNSAWSIGPNGPAAAMAAQWTAPSSTRGSVCTLKPAPR